MLASEWLQVDPSCDLFVELRRVEEDVDWGVLPPQPRLPISLKEGAVIVRRDYFGWKSNEDGGSTLGTDEHVEVEVYSAPRLLRAPG